MLMRVSPAPALAPFVRCFGYLEAPFAATRERVLPSGGMQLLVNLDTDEFRTYHPEGVRRVRGAALQGACRGPSIIDTAQQRAIAWVTFRPAGAHPFFPTPADEACDQLVDLAELWGRDGETLRERLWEAPTPRERLRALHAALLQRAARPLTLDPAVSHAVARLERGATVSAVADSLGVSRRHIARRFSEQVGLTPKSFARVRRFQRLIGTIGSSGAERDWARLAIEHGYCDQPHMIHEFRDLAGVRPGDYRPRSRTDLNHVPIEPVAPAAPIAT